MTTTWNTGFSDEVAELTELRTALSMNSVTSLEKERCRRELKTVCQRLTTKEYVQSNFRPRNLLSIPDRTDEIFKDLRFFWSVGALWQELFARIGLTNVKSVLDIGCGFFPKIELGLYYSGYAGAVTLVDPNQDALTQASNFLKFFKVSFTPHKCALSLWELPMKRYDLIVANHLLDDLLLDGMAQRFGLSLSEVYRSEALFQKVWSAIAEDSIFGAEMMQRLAHTLSSRVKHGGTILLLDYPSFSHRAMKLAALMGYIAERQADLRVSLEDAGIKRVTILGDARLKRERLAIRESHLVVGRKI